MEAELAQPPFPLRVQQLERGVWVMWVDAAPRMLPASQIVDTLGLKGPRDIPGILSWVVRKGNKVGFSHVVWRFRTDPLTKEPHYGIEDLENADLLKRARAQAERVL